MKYEIAISLTFIAKFALSLCLLVFLSGQDTPYLIHGRAVDAKGYPVKNALIAWDPIQERGGTVELGGSDELGHFTLSIPQYMKSKPLRLFVTTGMPSEATVLLSPPFITEPGHFTDRYAGPQLTLDKLAQVNVGDVPVKLVFALLSLTILDNKGAPRLTNSEQWSKVVIRLLDRRGRLITASTISEADISRKKTVDLTKSEIKVAVPEGRWRIEVSIGSFEGPFWGEMIQVSRSERKILYVNIKTP